MSTEATPNAFEAGDDAELSESGSENEWIDTDTSLWPRPWGLVAKHFKEHAQDNETLDIYQMVAFISNSKNSDNSNCCKRYFYYAKAICCAVFQTVGIIALICNEMANSDKDLCEMGGDWAPKTIAIVASFYIALTMFGMMQHVDEQGLYEIEAWEMKNMPPFIQPKWWYLGFHVNSFALVGAVYGSIIVIYLSPSALEVVLNSVALFFIVELDDLMVDEYDYKRIRKYFDQQYDPKNFDGYEYEMGCCESKFFGCVNIIIVILIIVAVLCGFAAPIYLAICY